MAINVTVWNENVHDKNEKIRAIYPDGLHGAVKAALDGDGAGRFITRTALLDQPEQGLPDDVLNNTDVLFWWGHVAHEKVENELVERVWKRVVAEGMGLVLLHSAHYSKIFKRVMGTICRTKWRESGDRERIWVIEPGHPIASGLPEYFELPAEETYGERFDIPAPDELVFISWFSGGEVLRSGNCFYRGCGKVFYFQPGHETFPTFHDRNIQKVLCNAAAWAAPVKGPKPTFGKFDMIGQA